ncbi:uncharacterized protein LOC106646916 [Copidosoma floridanum]|uniref:uncharacterized protein LOC106646916 n=1 Tax=Copidosoma floridanum TaxID=29053 RepID=UPI0006C96119|nr:uncharacterized protein LOC106646916 [Copidosoma floridanum]
MGGCRSASDNDDDEDGGRLEYDQLGKSSSSSTGSGKACEQRALADWRSMVELHAGPRRASCHSGRRSITRGVEYAPRPRRLYYTLLTILDAVFSGALAGPAVVGYWRGTWGLSGFYVYPGEPELSSLASILIGFCGLFAFSLAQTVLATLLHPDRHRLCFYVGSRLYTALYGLCCVNAWRGTWQALDLYTEHTFATVFTTTCVSLLALAVMRTLRNISAPPFAISLDTFNGYFDVPTLFRVDNSKDWSLYILDCAFSVGVVGTLVVFVWRGAWVLFDLYLFPENREHSAVGSLVIGYVIVVVSFTLQPLMRCTCSRLTGLARLLAADGYLLVSFIGTVNVWRGIWNVLDLYLLPEDPKLSCWITHLGCFVFLMLLNCSNSVLVRGVYIDAEEEEAGKCVVFPCHYLRLFFKVEREKKEVRRRNLIVASRDLVGSRGDPSDKETENGALLNATANPVIRPAHRVPESLV